MKKFNQSRDLAKYLGVSEATIVKWRRQGMPYKQVGLGYEYNLDRVLTWLVKKSPKHRQMVEQLLKKKR